MIFIFLIVSLIYSTTSTEYNKSEHFESKAINDFIKYIKPQFFDQKLAEIYSLCFTNTLDTTVQATDNDTFVITGDIEAMWLRDSTFQTFPYIEFAKIDEKLKKMLLNLIKRHTRSILIDPYANAFNKDEFESPWQSDETYKLVNGTQVPAMNKKLWERKYELDSTVSTLFFAYNFYSATNDTSFVDENWLEGVKLILDLARKQSMGTDEEDEHGLPEYYFERNTKEPFDSLHQGRGNPAASCGLVKSAFRNSDDAALFQYSIPENAFLSVTFIKISELLKSFDSKLANELLEFGIKVKDNIYKYGVITEGDKKFFAYEVDCYGNYYFMDDPGYPSLTSLPFIGFVDKNDEIYKYTRQKILSKSNPYYFEGKIGQGLGSAHTDRHYIWPLFTIMRVLTSDDKTEIMEGIKLLMKTAETTNFMHESVNINDIEDYSRPWFAWANSFFGHMINDVIKRYPELILNIK